MNDERMNRARRLAEDMTEARGRRDMARYFKLAEFGVPELEIRELLCEVRRLRSAPAFDMSPELAGLQDDAIDAYRRGETEPMDDLATG